MKTIKLFFLVLLFIIFFPFYVITKGVFESIDEEDAISIWFIVNTVLQWFIIASFCTAMIADFIGNADIPKIRVGVFLEIVLILAVLLLFYIVIFLLAATVLNVLETPFMMVFIIVLMIGKEIACLCKKITNKIMKSMVKQIRV